MGGDLSVGCVVSWVPLASSLTAEMGSTSTWQSRWAHTLPWTLRPLAPFPLPPCQILPPLLREKRSHLSLPLSWIIVVVVVIVVIVVVVVVIVVVVIVVVVVVIVVVVVMWSTCSRLACLQLHHTLKSARSTPTPRPHSFPAAAAAAPLGSSSLIKSSKTIAGRRCSYPFPLAALDDGFDGAPSLFDEGDGMTGADSSYTLYSSGGEESDTDLIVNPTADVDLPLSKEHQESQEAALTVTAHRFATINQRGYRRKRIRKGVLTNMGLIVFLVFFLLFVDWWSWRIVRIPLEPFYLTHPFLISAVLSACAGCLYIPIVDGMKLYQILRKGSMTHPFKKNIPTMGGLFFIPIGIAVARGIADHHSLQVCGAAMVTLAFAAVGLLDDILSHIKNHNYGLPGGIKFFLQFLVPLPPPIGLLYLGKLYLGVTTFCFVSMANGVNLTDGLDGLAGGASASAFIGMSIAILPICPELAVFGASMAGACIGFLFHNRYKASVYMGDTGSLALGAALAAMAACTGMFLPLLISSAVFVLEVFSVIVQVFSKKVTRCVYGTDRRVFHTAPLHHHFELSGIKEPVIVAGAYVASCILALCAGYVGLISA